MKNVITQEIVRYLFNYNPDTGEIFWKNPQGYKVNPGDNACSLNNKYYTVHIYMVKIIMHIELFGYMYMDIFQRKTLTTLIEMD